MLFLLRKLPGNMSLVVLAAQRVRGQAKESGHFNDVAVVLAALIALWTYSSEKRKQWRSERVSELPWEEALNG